MYISNTIVLSLYPQSDVRFPLSLFDKCGARITLTMNVANDNQRRRGRGGFVNAVRNGRLDDVRLEWEMGEDIHDDVHDDVDFDDFNYLGHDWESLDDHVESGVEWLKFDYDDVNILDMQGDTPLLIASYRGCKATVVKLLKHDEVDVNHHNKGGYTALTWASYCGHTDIVVEVLKHDKVNLDLQTHHGDTALTWASRRGHTDIVVELLKHGKVNVNLPNKDGDTALVAASIHGHANIVWQLLKHNPWEALVGASPKGLMEMAPRLDEHGQNGSRLRRMDDEKPQFDRDEQPARKKQNR
jgi:ankyrin repeat protein